MQRAPDFDPIGYAVIASLASGRTMQSGQLQRRKFITLLGGTAAAWPLVARGQQGERVRRIGVLMNTGADEPESQARLAAFMQGLQEVSIPRQSRGL